MYIPTPQTHTHILYSQNPQLSQSQWPTIMLAQGPNHKPCMETSVLMCVWTGGEKVSTPEHPVKCWGSSISLKHEKQTDKYPQQLCVAPLHLLFTLIVTLRHKCSYCTEQHWAKKLTWSWYLKFDNCNYEGICLQSCVYHSFAAAKNDGKSHFAAQALV